MLLGSTPAFTQDTSVSIALEMPPVQRLETISTQGLPAIGPAQFAAGSVAVDDGWVFEVSSNVDWELVFSMPTENLYNTPGLYKSIEDCALRLWTGDYITASLRPQVIARGQAGDHHRRVRIDYRLALSWGSTPPGQLSIMPRFQLRARQ